MTKMKALRRQWCELQQAARAECGGRLGGDEAREDDRGLLPR